MPGERPLVSIVTPSLDQGRYIERAIESVLEQTYTQTEHVVVDGGSTDGTLDVLRRHEHLRWVSEPDRGQAHALNKGFTTARGDILGWLNSDDYYLPNAVEEAVEALRVSGAAVVYADVERVDDDDRNPRRIRSRPSFDLWTELNFGCGIYSPSVFFTRAALDAVGGLDESLQYVMDYDLWLRIGRLLPVHHVDAVWAVHRLHDAAKSVAEHDRFWPERLAVSRRHGGRLLSPLLVRRYVRQRHLQRLVTRSVSLPYALSGRRAASR